MDYNSLDISASSSSESSADNNHSQDEQLCDNCFKICPVEMLDNTGTTYGLRVVCVECIANGKVWKCFGCDCFIPLGELFENDSFKNIGKAYCSNCAEVIIFVFNIYSNSAFLGTISIDVPVDNNLSLPWSYFYQQIAKKLAVKEKQIMIGGQTLASIESGSRKKIMCPLEYKDKSRVFDAVIIGI